MTYFSQMAFSNTISWIKILYLRLWFHWNHKFKIVLTNNYDTIGLANNSKWLNSSPKERNYSNICVLVGCSSRLYVWAKLNVHYYKAAYPQNSNIHFIMVDCYYSRFNLIFSTPHILNHWHLFRQQPKSNMYLYFINQIMGFTLMLNTVL